MWNKLKSAPLYPLANRGLTLIMRIVLIKSELYRTGGLEKYTWQLARDFCSLGCQVTLLTTGSITPPFEHPELEICSFPISYPLSVLNVLHFDRAVTTYLSQHHFPIIFSLDRTRYQTHIRAGNGVHARYLQQRIQEEGFGKRISFSLNPLHRTILSLEKRGFEHPELQLLFTNSQMVKRELLTHYDLRPEKIQVIHNGVEWHHFQSAFDSWEEVKQPSSFQLLFVGHNYKRKGLDKLLRALSLLRSRDFQLHVIGKDKNIPYYRHLAATLQLEKKVNFVGPTADILPYYQRADALVIPSTYDPFANVTVEALAMGLFVVSSTTNGGHEVLTPESGTIIEDLNCPDSCVNALEQAFSRPKTPSQALAIRSAVRHLDFSSQLRLMTQATLKGHLS